MRYIATFTPQAWINDYAVTVDAEGETTWDVTEHLNTLSPADRQAVMKPNTDASDTLREIETAPAWIRNWSGPFMIEVQAVAEATEPAPETDRESPAVSTTEGETTAVTTQAQEATEPDAATVDRLLGLADQFLADWKDTDSDEHPNDRDPDLPEREAEWAEWRPRIVACVQACTGIPTDVLQVISEARSSSENRDVPAETRTAVLQFLKDHGLGFSEVMAVMGENEEDNAYIAAARSKARAGEIEVDNPSIVSQGEDAGAYVLAWMWVEKEEAYPDGQDEDEEDEEPA